MDSSPACLAPVTEMRTQKWTAALFGALVLACFAAPASAAREPSARLVECGEENCLLVTGHRDDAATAVSINGRAVAVEGERRWRVRVPVETVRLWSAPHARTIEVALAGRESGTSVKLPIGLLGQITDLAALEVRVR